MCSQEVKLPFKGIRKRSDGNRYVKRYWSLKKDCRNCPLKAACAKIEDTVDKSYYDRMLQRVHTRKGRTMKKLRSATVEPVLGTLLHFVGMKKVYTKGFDLANKHVLLACTAYNIKKWMAFTKRQL